MDREPSTDATESIQQAQAQYEQYLRLVEAAKTATSYEQEQPQFYAPLPAPLTLSSIHG